ncbi:hypothetical protein GLOTRDRAFT_137894 [Gloeophyllum trabeum ATCC 11539]|uniref:Mediator of RNA polymerase II transcription subunit 12 n=1 Tax=Gloeophyllum trabeum (strain ATCC 11539 / FP-39264 / Madison 617) TaxID=670483 RepID=S7RWD4_GLOTA|nr:uncharacterized protein GLOTRDRAFT_137894 [Gloeophyllum trabeum ATCC 11539]EPQ57624.1 hypothetical protein GLOTRDRAFT_137894 [Gloeophyllum trabeum ATCC 11539]
MRESRPDKVDPPIYELRPPEWLPKVSTSADLGYIGFHPPHPGQPEDVLSQSNIQNGFSVGHTVSAETFTSVEAVNQHLKGEVLTELDDFMNQVFARRAESVPAIPPSSFRLPSRVTLNDAKRHAWFEDLANPDVPLQKLGKSVPHGAKGGDLLDLLQAKNVAIPRAVWFLRVFGANETAGLRNKPSYNPTQYSVEWANVVTAHLKKQLSEIALPVAVRAGMNVKQTFKGVLSDPASRERWMSRFSYCLDLLRTFYAEGLVDNRTFLSWLVQQMASCNLAQAGFVARLADEYLDGMLVSRALTRPFVDACLNKLAEIKNTAVQDALPNLESSLTSILQRVCLGLPDAFVSPRTWATHADLISAVLRHKIGSLTSQAVQQDLEDNITDITRRNEALLLRSLPPRALADLSSAVRDVQLLNSLSTIDALDRAPFFDAHSEDVAFFSRKLDLLLSWCVTPLQYGDHRTYAAMSLLSHWRNQAQECAWRRNVPPNAGPAQVLQDLLFDWLDDSEVAGDPENLRAIAWLYGGLAKHDLFSYAEYLQRLVSRGEQGLSDPEKPSRHRRFLRWIPLQKSTPALVNQRKVILYGVRARETPEDAVEKQLRKEVRALLPELFDGMIQSNPVSLSSIAAICPLLINACRFEQIRTVGQWFLPVLRKYIMRHSGDQTDSFAIASVYCTTITLLELVKCYESILEMSLLALQHVTTSEMLTAVLETLRRHLKVWICMDATGSITSALYEAHQYWRHQGIQTRALLDLLTEMDAGRHLDQASRDQLEADVASLATALCPHSDHRDSVPAVLPEILLLAQDLTQDAPSRLANSLWYKYRTAPDWAWKVWDNTVASLRQIPMMSSDPSSRHICALRYGSFLLHVDQHLPRGFDEQVLEWCLGSGKNEVAALTSDSWPIVTIVLLFLAVQGALTITTILQGFVYPAWQSGANCGSPEQGVAVQVFLCAANDLFERLLLASDCNLDDFPPSDLLQLQRLFTRRLDVYGEKHFPPLVAMIPNLVFIEESEFHHDDIRSASRMIREKLCRRSDFRQGAYRNLDTVRVAIERTLESETISPRLHKPLVNALRLILSDSGSDELGLHQWQAVSSLFSPWKLAATAIEMKFVLRGIAEGMSKDETRREASANLDKLTAQLLHHSMTSEQVDFVADMARGVGHAVAGKFVNNGLKCIAELIGGVPQDMESQKLRDFKTRTGELLRLLVQVLDRCSEERHAAPQLDALIQEQLFNGICVKLEAAEVALKSSTFEESSDIPGFIIELARLLQFDMRCENIWTPPTKELLPRMTEVVFRLALLHSSGNHFNVVSYSLLLDTLCYLLDAYPVDLRSQTVDLFRLYPQISLSDLPPDMPPPFRVRVRSLLPYVNLAGPVENLAYASAEPSGSGDVPESQLVPVQNRPWEWVEYLGDPITLDPKEEEKEKQERERLRARQLVKNTTSLSLELFGTQVTSDRAVHVNDADSRLEGDLRSFQDGLWGESIFKRDWRESRVQLVGSGAGRSKSEEDEDGTAAAGMTSSLHVSEKRKQGSRKPSPASSVVSRSSAHPSHHSGSRSTTPTRRSVVGSSMSEPIDVDSVAVSVGASKRARDQDGDDEVEILDTVPSGSKAKKARKTTGRKSGKKKS